MHKVHAFICDKYAKASRFIFTGQGPFPTIPILVETAANKSTFHLRSHIQGERWDIQHERDRDAMAQKEKSVFDRMNSKKERDKQIKDRIKARQVPVPCMTKLVSSSAPIATN
jgi:hypothetical protein